MKQQQRIIFDPNKGILTAQFEESDEIQQQPSISPVYTLFKLGGMRMDYPTSSFSSVPYNKPSFKALQRWDPIHQYTSFIFQQIQHKAEKYDYKQGRARQILHYKMAEKQMDMFHVGVMFSIDSDVAVNRVHRLRVQLWFNRYSRKRAIKANLLDKEQKALERHLMGCSNLQVKYQCRVIVADMRRDLQRIQKGSNKTAIQLKHIAEEANVLKLNWEATKDLEEDKRCRDEHAADVATRRSVFKPMNVKYWGEQYAKEGISEFRGA